MYIDDEILSARAYLRTTKTPRPYNVKTAWRQHWNNMRSRVRSGIWKKNNIEIRWTREDFRDWWLAQADRVLAIRAEGHSPSIDRRDPLGHYCEANCRIIPHHVNAALGEVNGLVSRMRVLQDLLKKNEHWLRD